MYFHCGQKTLVEGGLNEEFKTYIHSAPMKDEHLLTRANHDNPISNLNHIHDLEAGPRLWQAFNTYMDLVRNYSKRDFTFKPDILNGFAGILLFLTKTIFKVQSQAGPCIVFQGLFFAPRYFGLLRLGFLEEALDFQLKTTLGQEIQTQDFRVGRGLGGTAPLIIDYFSGRLTLQNVPSH